MDGDVLPRESGEFIRDDFTRESTMGKSTLERFLDGFFRPQGAASSPLRGKFGQGKRQLDHPLVSFRCPFRHCVSDESRLEMPSRGFNFLTSDVLIYV